MTDAGRRGWLSVYSAQPRIDRESETVTSTHLRSNFSKYELPLIIYLPWPMAIDPAWFDNDCLGEQKLVSLLFVHSQLSSDPAREWKVENRTWPGLEIAVQFLLGSFLPRRKQKRAKVEHTRPKGGIKNSSENFEISFPSLDVAFRRQKSKRFSFVLFFIRGVWVEWKIVEFSLF